MSWKWCRSTIAELSRTDQCLNYQDRTQRRGLDQDLALEISWVLGVPVVVGGFWGGVQADSSLCSQVLCFSSHARWMIWSRDGRCWQDSDSLLNLGPGSEEISDDYLAWWSKNVEEIRESCMFKGFSNKDAFPTLLKLGRAADTLDMMIHDDAGWHMCRGIGRLSQECWHSWPQIAHAVNIWTLPWVIRHLLPPIPRAHMFACPRNGILPPSAPSSSLLVIGDKLL